ncbi:unnamed protein product, partial [Prorocentrum cordatum]
APAETTSGGGESTDEDATVYVRNFFETPVDLVPVDVDLDGGAAPLRRFTASFSSTDIGDVVLGHGSTVLLDIWASLRAQGVMDGAFVNATRWVRGGTAGSGENSEPASDDEAPTSWTCRDCLAPNRAGLGCFQCGTANPPLVGLPSRDGSCSLGSEQSGHDDGPTPVDADDLLPLPPPAEDVGVAVAIVDAAGNVVMAGGGGDSGDGTEEVSADDLAATDGAARGDPPRPADGAAHGGPPRPASDGAAGAPPPPPPPLRLEPRWAFDTFVTVLRSAESAVRTAWIQRVLPDVAQLSLDRPALGAPQPQLPAGPSGVSLVTATRGAAPMQDDGGAPSGSEAHEVDTIRRAAGARPATRGPMAAGSGAARQGEPPALPAARLHDGPRPRGRADPRRAAGPYGDPSGFADAFDSGRDGAGQAHPGNWASPGWHRSIALASPLPPSDHERDLFPVPL